VDREGAIDAPQNFDPTGPPWVVVGLFRPLLREDAPLAQRGFVLSRGEGHLREARRRKGDHPSRSGGEAWRRVASIKRDEVQQNRVSRLKIGRDVNAHERYEPLHPHVDGTQNKETPHGGKSRNLSWPSDRKAIVEREESTGE